MIAKVIVDLPVQQTDRPFDYIIPDAWEPFVQPGARVTVPFGGRPLLGFVIEIASHSDITNIKPIQKLVDYTPVLNSELLGLGDWLASSTICRKITAFQTLLPAAMKAAYKKVFQVQDHDQLIVFYPELAAAFNERSQLNEEVLKKMMSEELNKQLQDALAQKIVTEETVVKSKSRPKRQQAVRLKVTGDALDEVKRSLSKKASKQVAVLDTLKATSEDILLAKLIEVSGASRSSVQALAKKGYLEIFEKEIYRLSSQANLNPDTPPVLTAEQREAMTPILDDLESGHHHVHVCHGVTGSGKTEIYLQSIDVVLKQGKSAIVLVPEIALTPQMVSRFKRRFGSDVAVMHSGLSSGEKYDEWRKIHRGEVNVVVGARSAVFAPFKKVGIIIIDEEHESSYKQEENPRYHAKDVAIFRGKYHQCPVVLGSATPSLDSFARAQKGVYQLETLTKRINDKAMPDVTITDMREELRNGNRTMFSEQLFNQLKTRLEKGEQSVLFLNRRGYSTFVMCRDCGYVTECPHCDISLTYHRRDNQMRCHYCGWEQVVETECPSCQSEHIRYFGSGTQKVEEHLSRLLPEARVIRMDVDTTSRKGAHERLLKKFGNGEADILLGTQMIAKGLDFPNVTLVGVLAADAMLNIPDFRSAERTFQLLTQVAGRAGRHKLTGEVVIQSYAPEHYAIQMAASHNYHAFYQKEMVERRQHRYPPFCYIALVTISHEELTLTVSTAEKIGGYLKQKLSNKTKILGPVAPPIARINNRFRYHCLIKYREEPELHATLSEIINHYQSSRKVKQPRVTVDLNPFMLL